MKVKAGKEGDGSAPLYPRQNTFLPATFLGHQAGHEMGGSQEALRGPEGSPSIPWPGELADGRVIFLGTRAKIPMPLEPQDAKTGQQGAEPPLC